MCEPDGVELLAEVGEPDDPPHVLFVGSLSEEKGILELFEASAGLPRISLFEGC